MGILEWLRGPSPEKLEQNGDTQFEARQWGQAKLAYERAAAKLAQTSPPNTERLRRIEGKAAKACQALAQEHRQNAEAYIEGGYFADARELLNLAIEVSPDPHFRKQQQQRLAAIDTMETQTVEAQLTDTNNGLIAFDHDDQRPIDDTDEEYFRALCGTLPEDVQQAYLGYGEAFKTGYIALNRGQFEMAHDALAQAMAQNPDPASYIPLERATACFNLNRLTEARQLLEAFLKYHPGVLPAYKLLCEVYWEQHAFDAAEALLTALPPELAVSIAGILLRGETLSRSGKLNQARELYEYFLSVQGWNASIAQALAQCHESLNAPGEALTLYKQLIDECTSCHAPVEPAIRHRYAELSFEAGEKDTKILEMYLALAQEIPENAARYFERVSAIYAAQGHTSEAERFRALALQASRVNQDKG